jgi:hypothetical protein
VTLLRDRSAALLGVLGVAGNVLGVAALADVPAAYRPASLDLWAAQAAQHPGATSASAVAFALGLLALAGWARGLALGLDGDRGRAGIAAMIAGAAMNGAGCVAPLVLVTHVLPGCTGAGSCAPTARALLGLTLSLDAAFNFLFGLGLALEGASLVRRGARWLGALGLAAGLATLPVSLQVVSERAASLLYVAAPLWLAFVLATSVLLWRAPAGAAASARLP